MSAIPDLLTILREHRTIAIVGISAKPDRPGFYVPKYLQDHGYRIIPVNPNYDEVLGETCYPDLGSIPEPVDIVDLFQRAETTPGFAREAVAIGANVLWLQLGIVNHEARQIAEDGGLTVVMDHCIKVEHARLFGHSS